MQQKIIFKSKTAGVGDTPKQSKCEKSTIHALSKYNLFKGRFYS